MARGGLFLLLPINALALGGLVSGFAVPGMLAMGSALVNMPAALAVGRFGAKRVMVFGLAAGLLGAVTIALTSSLLLMGAAALFHGLGMGVWGLARLVYLSEHVPPERRGRQIAPIGGMYRAGMLAGPALGGMCAQQYGRTGTLLVAAGLVGAALLTVAFACPGGPSPGPRRGAQPSRIMRVFLDNRGILATAGGAMWALGLLRGARLLLIPICGTLLGLSETEVGWVKSLSAFADLLLFVPAGQLMDRVGRKWSALPCMLVLSVGVMLIGGARDYTELWVAGLVAGVGNGFGCGINMTLAGDFAPARMRADFIGAWRLVSDSGAAAAPFVMGAVAQAVALGAAGVVVGGVGLAGAAVLASCVPEPRRPAPPAGS